MSTIFLSYAREDRPRVAQLAEQIEARGWDVWWDREIPLGTTFDQVIEEALEECSCVIAIWTATSVDSRWVRTEAAEGLTRGILLPVLLDDVVMPLAFRRIQAADLTDWQPGVPSEGFDGLMAAIATLVDPAAISPADAAPGSATVGAVVREGPPAAAVDTPPPAADMEPPADPAPSPPDRSDAVLVGSEVTSAPSATPVAADSTRVGDPDERRRSMMWGSAAAAGVVGLGFMVAAVFSSGNGEEPLPTGAVAPTSIATTTTLDVATTPAPQDTDVEGDGPAPAIAVPLDWPITFATEFDDNTGNWKEGDASFDLADVNRQIIDGEYVWSVTRSEGLNNKSFPDHGVVADFYVEADVDMREGGVWHGIVFRNTAAGFYAFLVNEDGRYEVVRYAGPNRVETLVARTATNLLESDGFNLLTVRAEGTEYEFGINRGVVATIDDDELDAGQVGLALDLAPGETALIVIDRFLLREPGG